MKGKPITYKTFTVYPELCGYSLEEFTAISKVASSNYHIASVRVPTKSKFLNMGVIIRNGQIFYRRLKSRLHYPDESDTLEGKIKPEVIQLDEKNILFLVCYELLFPEDYLPVKTKPDIVIHIVGCPMVDEEQREGWVAMQKALAIMLGCPLVCCCGGDRGRMNISAVMSNLGGEEVTG